MFLWVVYILGKDDPPPDGEGIEPQHSPCGMLKQAAPQASSGLLQSFTSTAGGVEPPFERSVAVSPFAY